MSVIGVYAEVIAEFASTYRTPPITHAENGNISSGNYIIGLSNLRVGSLIVSRVAAYYASQASSSEL